MTDYKPGWSLPVEWGFWVQPTGGEMTAPIPNDLQELYAAVKDVEEDMPELWIPYAAPRVSELIERIATLEAQNQQLRDALKVAQVRRAASRVR